MSKAKGKETKQHKGQLEILKWAWLRVKKTREQGIVGNIKMGKAKGEETKQNKEQRKILKWIRLRGKKQTRTSNTVKY